MEVILKQDIANLGYENDIVTVKNGYARNFLIPKGMAIAATESNKKVVAEIQKQKAHKEEKVLKEAEALAKALENITVKIGAKAGTTGKIFGSVTNIQIAEAIQEQFNYEIDRKRIMVDTVKEVGTYKAKINLHKEVQIEVNFEVEAE